MGEGLLRFIVNIPAFCERIADFFAGKTGYLAVLGVMFAVMLLITYPILREDDEDNEDEELTKTDLHIATGLMIVAEFIVCALLAKVVAFVLMVLFLVAYNLGFIGLVLAFMAIIWGGMWLLAIFPPL